MDKNNEDCTCFNEKLLRDEIFYKQVTLFNKDLVNKAYDLMYKKTIRSFIALAILTVVCHILIIIDSKILIE